MTLWAVYALAAICEIAGCFAFWAWLRQGHSAWWAAPGVALLIAFAWLLTRVDVDAAGRAFAAYGGVYIVASVLWLWLFEGKTPTTWDMAGAGVSLVGAIIVLMGAAARSTS